MEKLTTITIILILMQGTRYLSAQDWHLTGNAGTNASTNFIGTTDNVALKLRTNNTVRLTINSSGKVGIGTSSPQDKFHVNGTGNLARFGTGTTAATFNYWYTGNDIGSYIEQRGNTTTTGSDKLRIQSSLNGNQVDYSQFIIDPTNGFSFLGFSTGNGNVGIGSSSPPHKLFVRDAPAVGDPVVYIENSVGESTCDGLYIKTGTNAGNGGGYLVNFLRPDGVIIGHIQQNSAVSVQYLTTSDKRLKNIIGASQKGLSDLMKISIYDYTFISDPNKMVQTGFMAQELYEVFPQSVSKPRDNNEPAEKNPWMVDYGSVTPLIIKSVQEQQQMIDVLKKSNDELSAGLLAEKKQNENLQSTIGSLQKEVADLKSSISQHSSMTDGYVRAQVSPLGGARPDDAVGRDLEGALLGQNIPNPFDNSTLIPFRIPCLTGRQAKDCNDASIMITNTSTSEVISVIPISCYEDHVSVDAGTLASGTYSYTLYVDGKMIDTKSMELLK